MALAKYKSFVELEISFAATTQEMTYQITARVPIRGLELPPIDYGEYTNVLYWVSVWMQVLEKDMHTTQNVVCCV